MMKQRCLNDKVKGFKNYGGRAIGICERWENSFLAFLADMGEMPEGMSLDRIDNEGDYCPENCRWATPVEQANNTRRTRKVMIDGEVRLARDVAKENGVCPDRIGARIGKGWSLEQAVGLEQHYDPRAVTIGNETLTLAQWAKRIGISRQAVHQRLQWGWSIEKALTAPKIDLRQQKSRVGKAVHPERKLVRKERKSVRKEKKSGLGGFIEEQRHKLKLNQKRLASYLGISVSKMVSIEMGRMEPSIKNCIALARLFEITLDDLVAYLE
jgi:DNA-binding XRE family transcriptional regulator